MERRRTQDNAVSLKSFSRSFSVWYDVPTAVIRHVLGYCSDRSAMNYIQANHSIYHYWVCRWQHRFNEMEIKDLVERTQSSNHKMPFITLISFSNRFDKSLTSSDGNSTLPSSLTSLTFGNDFNQPFPTQIGILPSSLTCLTLGVDPLNYFQQS